MKAGFLAISLLFLLQIALGQNLVPNSSFESYINCPTFLNQFNEAPPWQTPVSHSGDPDYYNACGSSFVSVPSNMSGFQSAYEGNAYGGLILWGLNYYREYLTVPLLSPLVSGTVYTFSLQISLADTSQYATDGLQFLFTNGPPLVSNSYGPMLNYTPQIANPLGNILNNSSGWTQVSGTFTAVGGEDWLTIGNFLDSSLTTDVVVNPANVNYTAYYYIDSLQLTNANFYILGLDALCGNDSMVLEAFNSSNYWWSTTTDPLDTLSTDSFLVILPGVTTSYLCHALAGTDTFTVNVGPIPTINLGPDTTLCGNSLLLNAGQSGIEYDWSTGDSVQAITVNQSGNYWVTIADSLGCTATDSIQVSMIHVPLHLGNDTSLCGDSLLLTAPPGYTYQWSDGTSLSTMVAYQTGTYSLALNNNGCISYDTILVNIFPVPWVDLGTDTFFCTGTLQLDADNPGSTHLWSDNSSTQTIAVNSSGSYHVTNTLGFCGHSDTIVVTIGPSPLVDLGPDTSLCAYFYQMDAGNPGATYLWSDGSTSQQLSVTQSGTYHVTANYGICSHSDTVVINIDEPVPPINLGPDVSQCADSLMLAAGNGSNYQWSTGATTAQIQITQSGMYWVISENGICLEADTIQVTLLETPVVHLGNDTLLCAGEDILLDIENAGATYLWSDGTTSSSIRISRAGSYWGEARIGACVDSDSISIRTALAPTLPEEADLCEDGIVILDAGNVRGEIIWSTGDNNRSITVTDAGLYSVVVTEEHCVMESSTHVKGSRYDKIYLPNAFKPDGNGRNDVFPGTLDPTKNIQLEIYNRWGEMIFRSGDNTGWDGTFQGMEAPIGMYVYRVVYDSECSGKREEISGHVVLVR